ncbi:MAG: hypothetical protein MJZ38_01075 [archaeon]|nr:hypothetical protein [archaeon]
MNKRAVPAVLLLVMPLLLVCLAPSSSADEYLALDDDISVSPSIVKAEVNSGDSLTIYLDIKNKIDKDIRVYVYEGETGSAISMAFPEGHSVSLKAGQIQSVVVVLTVDKFANTGDYNVSFNITLNDPDRGMPIPAAASNLVTITVHSTTAGTGMYNKFLGLWDNNLSSFLGDSLFTAVFSFVFIVCLGHLVCFELIPWVQRYLNGRDRQ